jgi:signal peptidase I
VKEPASPTGDDSTPLSLDDPAWVDAVVSEAVDEVDGTPPTAPSGGNGAPPVGNGVDPDPDESTPGDDTTEQGNVSDRTRSLVEWVVVIAGALVVALLIKTFLFQAFYIPSESMDPTLEVGDRVLVNKLSYDVHDVNRGDLIVFEKPEGEGQGGVQDLIKRVIGLPGETVTARDNVLYIDGKPLDEPYLQDDVFTDQFEGQPIPEGHVFVMGDNRTDSRDSRFFGPVPESDIVGRAFFRVWPPSEISFL